MSMLSPEELKRLSTAERARLANDRIAQYRETYAKDGAGRTNLAYGYALR